LEDKIIYWVKIAGQDLSILISFSFLLVDWSCLLAAGSHLISTGLSILAVAFGPP